MLNDREKLFIEDWKALLKKYDVEVSIETEYVGYYRDQYVSVYGYSKCDENGNKILDNIDIKLTDYL